MQLNIKDFYESTFGIESSADFAGDPRRSVIGGRLWGVDNIGREYYLPVRLTYFDKGLNELIEYDLPYPIVSIDGKKNVVKTNFPKRQGSFKEVVNIDDYEITIKGFAINNERQIYPEKEVQKLRSVFECNESIQISNAITDIFLRNADGMDNIVIESYEFPVRKGIMNIQPYILRCVSSAPFHLKELDKSISK